MEGGFAHFWFLIIWQRKELFARVDGCTDGILRDSMVFGHRRRHCEPQGREQETTTYHRKIQPSRDTTSKSYSLHWRIATLLTFIHASRIRSARALRTRGSLLLASLKSLPFVSAPRSVTEIKCVGSQPTDMTGICSNVLWVRQSAKRRLSDGGGNCRWWWWPIPRLWYCSESQIRQM